MDADVLRILDANLNRAREALRVVEEYARFVCDDADAAAAAKQCRHQLRGIAAALGADHLLSARDIVSDVGRDVKTPAELRRDSAEDVVKAAFARLTEAARVLGEYGKLISPLAAEMAETLRYRAYELEQRLVLRGQLRQKLAQVRLYVLITAALCRRPWLETAEAAIRGGAACLQLREKTLEGGELLRRARRLRELTARQGVLLAVNDRPDIAKLAGADIVHVGQDDLAVQEVRRVAGGAVLVGKSTHTVPQFEAALGESPDYLAIGPMFPSDTKPQPHVAGPETLALVRPLTELPIVAIGGITADTAGRIRAAGANCIAVCTAVTAADDPESAAREICQTVPVGSAGRT